MDQKLSLFLNMVQSPFRQEFSTDAFFASLGSSLGISAAILLAWCLVRPYNSVVYAPKLRNADEKHAPPRIEKGYFSWLTPLLKCSEADLLPKLGLDAIVFLRFLRMCRNIFFVLAILGCAVMIPVNVSCNLKNSWTDVNGTSSSRKWFVLMSPNYTWGNCMWAHVIVAWVFNFIIMYFLYTNYAAITTMRKNFFETPEYQASLHSRTLIITDIPSSYRSDDGLGKIIGTLSVPHHGDERCAIGRNVKDLPELIDEHGKAVRKLEGFLAKYLKNPDNLPARRPVCKPHKNDKSVPQDSDVDAIEYLGQRIKDLEKHIYAIRDTIDKRDALQYGFVSFPTISRAHIAAKATRGKHPKGTTIKLAPRPNDIIWDNLTRSKSARRGNKMIGNFLFVMLSILFVIPNALIAVFLSNLHNIAAIWFEFSVYLNQHYKAFAIVQGFLAPTITSIIYLLLPIVMRRISAWQGDVTKASRERHVTSKLYFFFVVNNLILFTLFGTLWTTIQTLVTISDTAGLTWDAVKSIGIATKIAIAMFDVSTFWITYLLQRNLGAILDIAQLVSLVSKSLYRRFASPTPRQMIEWTAPPAFEYATYYNYFLFYATIGLVFSTIQPIVLPIAFIYFLVDSFLKKYCLMYIFVTKVESDGSFWRLLFNRFLFATGFFNVVVALVVWVRYTSQAAFCVLPLIAFLIGFKFYCRRVFDVQIRYHTKGTDRESMISAGKFTRKDKLDKRYGHPALWRPLITPMVDAKAKHVLSQVYYGRINSEQHKSTYGDVGLSLMQPGQAGRRQQDPLAHQFEMVDEADMDFQNFKHRAEFASEHGGSNAYGPNFDAYSDAGTFTPPPGFQSPASSRPGTPTGRPNPSPLSLSMIGSDYQQVPNPAPPSFRAQKRSESPYLGDRVSMMSPDGGEATVDWSIHDGRSETGSVTHLLKDQGQHHYIPGSSSRRGPQYPQQPYDHEEYRGVPRR